jgi:hypothetical protein
MRAWSASIVALVAVGILVAASTGCGDDEPEYCSQVDELQSSVDTFKGDVTSANVSGLSSDVQTIKADADDVVSSARSDFPDETSAVESSVPKLVKAIEGLPQSPSASDLTSVAADVNAVVTSVDQLKSATSSECD